MGNRLILLGIAIAAVGLLALPQTLALFAGQHNFYDTATTNTVPCQKCHADVAQELLQPGQVNLMHNSQSPDGCTACHVTTAPLKEGLGSASGTGPFHAAISPMCLDCHSGTGPGVDGRSILLGSQEVHKPFAIKANSSGNQLLKGSNEACIACHTHVAVQINWTKAYMLSFSAREFTNANGTHDWDLSNFTAQGNATLITYGNRSGEINSSTKPNISISPTPLGFNPSNP